MGLLVSDTPNRGGIIMKNIPIFTALCAVLLLSACKSAPEYPDRTQYRTDTVTDTIDTEPSPARIREPKPKNIFPVSASYVDIGDTEGNPNDRDRIFRSREELDLFICDTVMPCYQNTESITAFLEKFDEDFFDDRLIYYHAVPHNTCSYQYEYAGSYYSSASNEVTVKWEELYEGCDEAISHYCFITELPKKDIPEGANILFEMMYSNAADSIISEPLPYPENVCGFEYIPSLVKSGEELPEEYGGALADAVRLVQDSPQGRKMRSLFSETKINPRDNCYYVPFRMGLRDFSKEEISFDENGLIPQLSQYVIWDFDGDGSEEMFLSLSLPSDDTASRFTQTLVFVSSEGRAQILENGYGVCKGLYPMKYDGFAHLAVQFDNGENQIGSVFGEIYSVSEDGAENIFSCERLYPEKGGDFLHCSSMYTDSEKAVFDPAHGRYVFIGEPNENKPIDRYTVCNP